MSEARIAKIVNFICALVLLFAHSSGRRLSEWQEESMDSYIESLMDCRHFGPGISIVMVRDDEIVYSKAFGLADVETGEDATQNHRFCIGSVTKSFTATLLANVMTEKTDYNFNTKIQDILGPDFKFQEEQRTKYAMLQDLLAHRMGSQRFDGSVIMAEYWNTSSAELASRLQYLEEVVPLRTEFIYNNYFFMLAGLAAEVIDNSNKTYEELVEERLLKPLKMNSAVWMNPVFQDWSMTARPHTYTLDGRFVRHHDEAVKMFHPTEAAGALCMTMPDMANWIRFHLGDGSNPFGGPPLTDKTLFLIMHNEHQQLPFSLSSYVGEPFYPVTITSFAYDLGFFTGTYRGYRVQFHSGALVGYNTQMWGLPDMNMGIIVINNGPTDLQNGIAIQLATFHGLDLLLDLDPWLNDTTACTFPEPWESGKSNTVAPIANVDLFYVPMDEYPEHEQFQQHTVQRPPEDYVGHYEHYFGGVVEITYDMDREELHFKLGLGTGYLKPFAEDVFLITFYGPMWFYSNSTQMFNTALQFLPDEQDPEKITSVLIPWISGELFPIFTKDLPDPTTMPPTTPCPPVSTEGKGSILKSFYYSFLIICIMSTMAFLVIL